MTNENDSLWIVFNGEIYNHAVLRREMERAGHRYRTRSDTETILHLYETYGPRCVDRLQGMFAFAVWDRRERRLLLARDRLGIKPLYYASNDHELLFASEIKGIMASGVHNASFNQAILPEFLANRYVAGAETFYRGVLKLLPGHLLEWSAEQGDDDTPLLASAAAERGRQNTARPAGRSVAGRTADGCAEPSHE